MKRMAVIHILWFYITYMLFGHINEIVSVPSMFLSDDVTETYE